VFALWLKFMHVPAVVRGVEPGSGFAPGGDSMAVYRDSRADRLATALDDFIRSSPDVEAAAVVSFDGLTMASALPDDLEEDRVGAMSAALLSLGEQAALGLGRGQLNQVFVEGEHGFVFLMSARDQAVLAAIARRTAKIGFMLFEMRRAAQRIGTILTPDVEADDAASELAALGVSDEPESVGINGAAPQQGAPADDLSGSELPDADLTGLEPPSGPPSGGELPGRDDLPDPPPWSAPPQPAEPGGWHEDDTSPLFRADDADEPSPSDSIWSR
jgi:uncharacterized protein